MNAYNPGLSGAWMLQRAMSVRPGERPDPNFINLLLAKNFAAMRRFGDPVLKPFLQVRPNFSPAVIYWPLATDLGHHHALQDIQVIGMCNRRVKFERKQLCEHGSLQ